METITGLLLTAIFFVTLIIIATEKIDKVSITLLGVSVAIVVASITGLIDDLHIVYQWFDLELIMTIVGVTIIMEMLKSSGLLEVFILYILRNIQGSFYVLAMILSLSVIVLSIMITNVLALIIVSSITILISQVGEFNPKPLLFLELVYSNLAGMLTPIASYTAAYVSLEQNWSYLDFIFLSLPFVIIMVLLTIPITYFMFKDIFLDMKDKETSFGIELKRLMKTIDPWSFVDSKKDFYKASIIFTLVTIFLAVGTSLGFSVDIICISGGITVLIFFSDHVESFIKAVDWPMLFFLTGIFIMSGLIQLTELPLLLNEPILELINISPELGIIGFSWVLGALTSIIENIPLIFLLRPLIDAISLSTNSHIVWWAILAVVNITDSVVLISSVKGIYIMEMSKREGIPITFMEYLRYGFIITGTHLAGMAIYIIVLLLI
ncbi:MAG: SLC13 family permease [Candidatus Hodarchaeales archaeon]|jgi:Na+/H+ antiporter NhaD/arsenite permease-like protein